MTIKAATGQAAVPFIFCSKAATLPDGAPADAVAIVLEYLNGATGRSVQEYDGLAASGVNAITDEVIEAANLLNAAIGTRTTVLSSEAVLTHRGWFEVQRRAAELRSSLKGIKFEDADPALVGGDYDTIGRYWFAFSDSNAQTNRDGEVLKVVVKDGNRRTLTYVGAVQINKVLHLLYPEAIPVFDGDLHTAYTPCRSAIVREVRRRRNISGATGIGVDGDGFAWEPLRRDLIANQNAGVLNAVREALADSSGSVPKTLRSRIPTSYDTAGGTQLAQWCVNPANVGDLRLLEMILWRHAKNGGH
jgi:hypothetical protein